MKITAAGLTDVGLQREHNEDCFRFLEELGLAVVADGMGGHQAGDVASRLAVETIGEFFAALQGEDVTCPFPFDPKLSPEENRLASAVKMANQQIHLASCADRAMHGMGTTVVALFLSPERDMAYVAHVGDSRAYRIRDGKITLLTRDHSLVNDYLTMMPDLPQEAMDVLPRNVITRALGMQDSVVVDILCEEAQAGDRYLLCTDGLSGQVADQRILELMESADLDLDDSCEKLVREANDMGGEDNVTVIIVGVD